MSKVLIADDSPSIRQLLLEVLTSAGCTVTSVSDGEDALAAAQAGQFDLVISDYNMPVMNGLELLRALRAMPAYTYCPILILSTEFSPEMKQEGKSAGATGWLVKPFHPEKLVDVIHRLLG